MKRSLLAVIMLCPIFSVAQMSTTISTVEFVKVSKDKINEATYFYENNWKVFREAAIRQSIIVSYRILSLEDSSTGFNVVLITDYKDSLQLVKSESSFQKLIKEIRPKGPLLLNDAKPNEFRKSVYTVKGKSF